MKKASLKKSKEQIAKIAECLCRLYPDAECALQYGGEPWKLLIMGRLSAQCTDARVNIVCEELFSVFPSAESIAYGDIDEIERIVRPCGLYRTKAANIKEACRILVEQYGGILPDDMDTLLTFPGVGRKIANLLLGDIYKKPAVVADTHCIRICGRFGFYDESLKDPVKVERIIAGILAPEIQSDFCHRIVFFGREYCTARSPRCNECPIAAEGLCQKHKSSQKA